MVQERVYWRNAQKDGMNGEEGYDEMGTMRENSYSRWKSALRGADELIIER